MFREMFDKRAELMTWLPGRPCLADDAPADDLRLTPGWWAALRRALAILANVSTDRSHADRVTRLYGYPAAAPHRDRRAPRLR